MGKLFRRLNLDRIISHPNNSVARLCLGVWYEPGVGVVINLNDRRVLGPGPAVVLNTTVHIDIIAADRAIKVEMVNIPLRGTLICGDM